MNRNITVTITFIIAVTNTITTVPSISITTIPQELLLLRFLKVSYLLLLLFLFVPFRKPIIANVISTINHNKIAKNMLYVYECQCYPFYGCYYDHHCYCQYPYHY